jgi:hypothetical protein
MFFPEETQIIHREHWTKDHKKNTDARTEIIQRRRAKAEGHRRMKHMQNRGRTGRNRSEKSKNRGESRGRK